MSYTEQALAAWAERRVEQERRAAESEAQFRLQLETDRLLCANATAIELHNKFGIADPPGADAYEYDRAGWACWVRPEDGIDLYVCTHLDNKREVVTIVYLSHYTAADPRQAGNMVMDLAHLGQLLEQRAERFG